MVTVGALVRVEAKPDKVDEVEVMLKHAVAVVQNEEATTAWFAVRLGPTTYGVFDVFPDEAGRRTHFEANGDALRAAAPALFADQPSIEYLDVIAAKLPEN